MAERRMFSKRIINSARFLKMPSSTQALYFHLGLNADDDGVVEAFIVMHQVGANDDDLRILVAKNFVKVLNDDLVAYIMDWSENNRIRADRKTDSIYKQLLLKVLPDANVQTPRKRADRAIEEDTQNGTSHGQPMDGIGKDRLGKDSKDNSASTDAPAPKGKGTTLSENFEKLWKLYPKKRDKKKAFGAYKRAIKKGVTNKKIQDGIVAMIREAKLNRTPDQFIRYGGTWFNQEGWDDEYSVNSGESKPFVSEPRAKDVEELDYSRQQTVRKYYAQFHDIDQVVHEIESGFDLHLTREEVEGYLDGAGEQRSTEPSGLTVPSSNTQG